MPYEGEFAQYRSIRRLAESERVRQLLGSYRIRASTSYEAHQDDAAFTVAPTSGWQPRYVVAVDGSHVEIPIVNGFPGAEASYVTVASVLIDVQLVRELDSRRPVNPLEMRRTENADSIDAALPGCNVVADECGSAEESLRSKLYSIFESTRMTADGESLLETYEVLLAYKPENRDQDCPYSKHSTCRLPRAGYVRGSGAYRCPCVLERPLYSTDALRIHEGMNRAGTNGAMFAEIMQVCERIWVIHVLRSMERNRWLGLLRDIAFVMDGPLAVFGHPAWLSQAISRELGRLNQEARKWNDDLDILLIGIEKSGAFVQHFDQVDIHSDGSSDAISRSSVLLLTDSYIKKNIIFSDSAKPYGADTYFGDKFLYKTSSGARIVATLPFYTGEGGRFPRLADALSVLDQLVSSRYANSLSPLIAAHAEAAIPLNLGKRVLEALARELIGTSRDAPGP